VRLRELERQAESNRKLMSTLNQFTRSISGRHGRFRGPHHLAGADAGRAFLSAPHPVLFLTTGRGLLLGALLAFLVEYLDSGSRPRRAVGAGSRIRFSGMVPAIRLTRLRWFIDRKKILTRLVNQPFSQISEAVRSIRMGITISDVDRSPRVLLVTSSVPAEGKSTDRHAARRLGGGIRSRRAVLIDCDCGAEHVADVRSP